jgi:hypothetical protein
MYACFAIRTSVLDRYPRPSISLVTMRSSSALAAFASCCLLAACLLGSVSSASAQTALCGQWSSCNSCASTSNCEWCGSTSSCSQIGYYPTYCSGGFSLVTSQCDRTASRAGVIAGAVIGSIAFVIILVAICICVRRRQLYNANAGMIVYQQQQQPIVFNAQQQQPQQVRHTTSRCAELYSC